MDAEGVLSGRVYALPLASNARHLAPGHETSDEGAAGAMGRQTMPARTEVLAEGPKWLQEALRLLG